MGSFMLLYLFSCFSVMAVFAVVAPFGLGSVSLSSTQSVKGAADVPRSRAPAPMCLSAAVGFTVFRLGGFFFPTVILIDLTCTSGGQRSFTSCTTVRSGNVCLFVSKAVMCWASCCYFICHQVAKQVKIQKRKAVCVIFTA